MHATHGAVTKVVPSHTPQPSAIAAEHPPPRFWIPPPQTKGYPLLKLDISMIMLAMMLSAVRGWSLPPSDESAQGSPLSLVNQSEITDGVVLAHDLRELEQETEQETDWIVIRDPGNGKPVGRETGGSCTEGWSVSPLRPTLSCATNPHVAFSCRRQRFDLGRVKESGVSLDNGTCSTLLGKLRPALQGVSRLPRRPSRRGRASHLWPTRVKPPNTCPTPPTRSRS